jgi:uncharacterized damage-inducible protein DinB
MTRDIVEALAGSFKDSANLISRLIEECPQDLWSEKAGLWPIWQHLTHACQALAFFCPGESPSLPVGVSPEIASLNEVGTAQVSKEALSDYLKASLAVADSFISGLSDDDLTKKNEKIKAFGLDWTIAKTLVLLSSHFLYHLGGADAVLRSHGHKGIF